MLFASEESPRMFESDFLDFFSRVPAVVVPIIYVPAISAFCAYGVGVAGTSPLAAVGQFALGVLVWSLMEYWLHRTLFHWTPNTSWGPKFHFFLHGVHHQWHRDKYRLVMPPAASISLGVLFFGITWLISLALSPLFHPAWIWCFFGGVMAGYLVYDMIHYYVHHFKPRTKLMKRLRAHHMAHHHNKLYQDKKYGVSSTLWDHVFGTYK